MITVKRWQLLVAGALVFVLGTTAAGLSPLSAQDHNPDEEVKVSLIAETVAMPGDMCVFKTLNNQSVYPDNLLIITPGDGAESQIYPIEQFEGESLIVNFEATGGTVLVEVQWREWTSVEPVPVTCTPNTTTTTTTAPETTTTTAPATTTTVTTATTTPPPDPDCPPNGLACTGPTGLTAWFAIFAIYLVGLGLALCTIGRRNSV